MTEVRIKVGDKEMTVAEARAMYDALRLVFGGNPTLNPFGLPDIKEWTKGRDIGVLPARWYGEGTASRAPMAKL